jgi:hypothetical protein
MGGLVRLCIRIECALLGHFNPMHSLDAEARTPRFKVSGVQVRCMRCGRWIAIRGD